MYFSIKLFMRCSVILLLSMLFNNSSCAMNSAIRNVVSWCTSRVLGQQTVQTLIDHTNQEPAHDEQALCVICRDDLAHKETITVCSGLHILVEE